MARLANQKTQSLAPTRSAFILDKWWVAVPCLPDKEGSPGAYTQGAKAEERLLKADDEAMACLPEMEGVLPYYYS